MRAFTIIAFILSLAPCVHAVETFPAWVVGVVDGDTLRVSRRRSTLQDGNVMKAVAGPA